MVDGAIGQVVAVTGRVEAVAPGAEPRALGCDGPLACEELVTAPGASVSFVSGDVLVRLSGGARVALAGSEGAPELFVRRGAVRTTDARSDGAAPLRLAARDVAASASGADLELSVSEAGAARLCSFDGVASVDAGPRARSWTAGGGARSLSAERCLAAEDGAYTSLAAGAPTIGLAAPDFCAFEVALDDHLTPEDVAAPDVFVFPGGDPAGDIPRGPCDDPGSGCTAGRDFPFEDPDPVPGCDVPGVSCGD